MLNIILGTYIEQPRDSTARTLPSFEEDGSREQSSLGEAAGRELVLSQPQAARARMLRNSTSFVPRNLNGELAMYQDSQPVADFGRQLATKDTLLVRSLLPILCF